MDLALTGKKALVTGATQGIGRAIATELAAEGCDVTLVARSLANLESTAAAIASNSGRTITFVAVDLTATDAGKTAVEGHLESHGGLDILVNNAGASTFGDFFTLSDADWDSSFSLKFHGYVRMCRAAFSALEQSGNGVIINNIGAASRLPRPDFLVGASINAALNNFTKGLAEIGLHRGVRVVSMNSGPIRTERVEATLQKLAEDSEIPIDDVADTRARDIFGMWRYGTPEDLARLATFLASDCAQHIHGSNILIDGGQTKEV